MGATIADLNQRQLDRMRTELAALLQVNVSYPPFFHHRSQVAMVRPVDRSKREEIEQFTRSVDFSPIERVDVTSPAIRRFVEHLVRRYIEVNEALRGQRYARYMPALLSRSPRMAAEFQRWLIAFVGHGDASVGIVPARLTWSGGMRREIRGEEAQEHNTRVLAAVLARGDSAVSSPHVAISSEPARPVSQPAELHPAYAAGQFASATLPVVVPPLPAEGSPFAGFEMGAQSGVFTDSISDTPTGPLPVPAAASQPAHARDLPPDLYQLYSDYLRDMQPEANDADLAEPEPFVPTMELSPMRERPDGMVGIPSAAASPIVPAVPPAVASTPAPATPVVTPATDTSSASHSDHQIFSQLRYQLEAFVRTAARSYGLNATSNDPSGVIDALRRSSFVDEADLRIAESILAITDRVTSSGAVTMEDYRQAFMLYLLYHRSHLGV